MKKLNKKQAKKYFKELEIIEQEYHKKIFELEEKMKKETGIKDIEFFYVDGEIVGIGNNSRTIDLIQRRQK